MVGRSPVGEKCKGRPPKVQPPNAARLLNIFGLGRGASTEEAPNIFASPLVLWETSATVYV